MTRPRLTSEPLIETTDVPPCPHCGGEMDSSTVTLETLISNQPLPSFVHVGDDGYAHGHQRVTVDCGWCGKPSALAIDERRVKLVAIRTEADDKLLWIAP